MVRKGMAKVLEWIDYNSAPSGFVNVRDLYLVYEPGFAIQVAIFRTGSGMVNVAGGYNLYNIKKIAKLNKPE